MDNGVRDKIIEWNINFPIDRTWRKKYNIAFNSLCHREISFLDQVFDLEEDKLFYELEHPEEYVPNIGDWLKVKEESSIEESIESMRNEFKDLIDVR